MESRAMLCRLVMPRLALAVLLVVGTAGQNPAFAQVVAYNMRSPIPIDLEGAWAAGTEDVSNDPVPVDYVGIPLNDAGRARAQSYDQAEHGMIERQCEGFAQTYLMTGPFGMGIDANSDPLTGSLISYTIGAWEDRLGMVIWMDGRPHPSEYAEHTRVGFTTGRWENGELIAVTTHMQEGHIRKNGPPLSDQAKLTLRFKRQEHTMLVIGILEDPLYLAEPMIWTRNYVLSTRPFLANTPPCLFAFEGTDYDKPVPHWLWGNKPYQDELTKKFGIPQEAILGYPETLYPDYRLKMSKVKPSPGK